MKKKNTKQMAIFEGRNIRRIWDDKKVFCVNIIT